MIVIVIVVVAEFFHRVVSKIKMWQREKKGKKVEIINLLIFSILFLLNDETFLHSFFIEGEREGDR